MRKKLIEVALPLEAINRESAREKSIRQGHPSTLHIWWARRPLAACRAVLFSSLIDDPDGDDVPQALLDRIDRLPLPAARGPEWSSLAIGEQRRKRLFEFIEKLVQWENSSDEEVLRTARDLIDAATGGEPPIVLDPFCGGGSIPLEAQRLGLQARASDLNPVAVLITKALVEIPAKFTGCPPVNPKDGAQGLGAQWKGANGLAADVRYYARLVRDQAEKRIGHLYPPVQLPAEEGGGSATVIAWLWARTTKCPNPACGAQMPLPRSFALSNHASRRAWVEPEVDSNRGTVRFVVRTGQGCPPDSPKTGRGAAFRCLVCTQPADEAAIRREFLAKRAGVQLMAVVAEGPRGRVYLTPTDQDVAIAESAVPTWKPEEEMNTETPNLLSGRGYGITHWHEIFTPRQLVALTTVSDLISEVHTQVEHDAGQAGLQEDLRGLSQGGSGSKAYADAVCTYLGFCLSAVADDLSMIVSWRPSHGTGATRSTFARQALPMVWDFAEANPFASAAGDLISASESVSRVVAASPRGPVGQVEQADATALASPGHALVCTDPPYYDNIGYADLSDFFYIWLRKSIGSLHPGLFTTVLTPKAQELVASSYRFSGDRRKAHTFFENGLMNAFSGMRDRQLSGYPLSVYYAFKQAESEERVDAEGGRVSAVASTGWETMLSGLMASGFAVTGTWPVRTERGARSIGIGTNALASSIVLACQPRPHDAQLATRRDLLSALRAELPDALRKLQHGNIAPVDLAQAAIGPGMAVFSRYQRVVDASGQPLSVRTALQLINQVLDEVLVEQESEYDPSTRWAIAWFEQFGLNEGLFGDAETLSKAKDVAVSGLEEAGILRARAGKVRLLRRDELPTDWDPAKDGRLTVWEITQHLIRAQQAEGDTGAAALLAKVGGLGVIARDLAYRLYVTCERKGWAQEALAYNGLVVAWPDTARLATALPATPAQGRLL